MLQTLETRGTVRENSSLGVPAHTCAVGLYFMGCAVHSVPAQPHKTKPCSRKHPDETVRKSSPQGVTIPNTNAEKTPMMNDEEIAAEVYEVRYGK